MEGAPRRRSAARHGAVRARMHAASSMPRARRAAEPASTLSSMLARTDVTAGRGAGDADGEFFAAGVGGAITGRGADLLIIDDPHSEQDALSPTAMESAYEWYTSGPRQRLQPGGIIIIVMTRWSTKIHDVVAVMMLT